MSSFACLIFRVMALSLFSLWAQGQALLRSLGKFTTGVVLSLLGLDFLMAKGGALFYPTVFYSMYL